MWWRARPGCDVGPFNLIGPTPEKPPASKGFALAAAQEYKKPVSSIIDLLVKIQLIDERQHEAVMSRSASRSGGHIVQQVAELGYATEGTMARAISVELGPPRSRTAMTPHAPCALELREVVNVADDIGGSAISRIARQLGVAVPANMPSRASRRAPLELTPSNTPAPPIETRTPKAISAIPPKTDPRAK